MVKLEDIHPLTDFLRNTRTYLKRLRRTGRPIVLTLNGHAELVVLSASAYERRAKGAAAGSTGARGRANRSRT